MRYPHLDHDRVKVGESGARGEGHTQKDGGKLHRQLQLPYIEWESEMKVAVTPLQPGVFTPNAYEGGTKRNEWKEIKNGQYRQ